MKISDALHKALADSGLSLYRIAKESGVGYTTLYHFSRREHTLHLDSADMLAAYFGLELTKPKETKSE